MTDAEDARLERAEAALGPLTRRYDDVLRLPDAASRLWQRAAADVQSGNLDDRPLYWARLKLLRSLRERGMPTVAAERQSRGFDTILPSGGREVLVTGFDPFHLDANIDQSNPSGLVALALDGTTIAGHRVRTAILPVRFADFDKGVVERVMTRYFESGLALALTVSMGRNQFDLERFLGLRRSVETPDNQNALTGATPATPKVPHGVVGPEFLEFSLPVAALTAVPGRWQVRDNRRVQTLERGVFTANSLAELEHQTAVQGSSGGYLSNEVAYRSLLLHKRLGCRFPLGHLHTPRVRRYDEAVEGAVIAQVRHLVAAALS